MLVKPLAMEHMLDLALEIMEALHGRRSSVTPTPRAFGCMTMLAMVVGGDFAL